MIQYKESYVFWESVARTGLSFALRLETRDGDEKMNRIKIKKKAEQIVVTQTLKKNELLNDMEIDVVNHNEIPSLVPIEIIRGFGRTKLRFCLSNAVPLPSYVQSAIPFSEFLRLVQQIICVIQDCEKHGIQVGSLDLHCTHIFYNYVFKTVQLLYWPLLSMEETAGAEPLFRWMGETYSSNQQTASFIGEYLGYFDRREEFNLFHFERAIRSLQHDWDEEEKIHQSGTRPHPTPAAPKPGISSVPTLLRLSSNTKIELTKFPFVLGRSPEVCDYAIADNTYVGKRHLELNRRGGRIYAVDLNSLNGTLLDGEFLSPGHQVELRSGCKLTLGNEEFMFFAQREQ
ncbi:MAG: FHA domain-containing protein [Clostridiales bacterium]|nr:FHA domain-containing protein [Clostridiales bacterium]